MWLSDIIRLRIKSYIIIDNFFPDEICKQLRENILNTKVFKKEYFDYSNLHEHKQINHQMNYDYKFYYF